MADLMKSSSGKLMHTSNGNLRLWSPAPAWHEVGTSYTGYGGFADNGNPVSDKYNINDDPRSTVYPGVRSAAMSALSPSGYSTTTGQADVGAAYNRGGAARASASVGGVVRSFVPPAVCTAAKIAVSGACQIGVFTSLPSGSQLLSASGFSPVGGYVDLEIFLGIINNRAEAGAPVYISACIAPPSSLGGSVYQYSWTNDDEEPVDLWGWLPVAPGETIYWKVSDITSFNATISASTVQLYY